MKKRIAAIVLHDGNISETKKCVESLFRQSTKPDKILVVNNCTENQFFCNGVVSINARRNIGAAAGRNLAAQNCNAGFLLFVDNDAVLEERCIEKLCATADSDDLIGAVSPVIFNSSSNKIWFSGGTISSFTLEVRHNEEMIMEDSETGYAPSTALLVKKSAFDFAGGFDERFFIYFEDADFCLRIKKRFTLVVAAGALVHHNLSLGDEKAKRQVFFSSRNRILLAKKTFNTPKLFAFLGYLLTVDLARNLFSFVSIGRSSLFVKHMGGIASGIKQ